MSDARTALEAIGQLPDSEIDIADAALQLARIDAPDADWQAARLHLSELARDAAALPAGDEDLAARAGALAGLITGRHGYTGDSETYEDLANANLIRVIERRRGMPVALGVIWLHCARAAGWTAHGLDFPGHFLIALEGSNAQAVLDVFAGGTPLDARDLRGLIKKVEGPKAELRPGMLTPVSTRIVLLRLQNNIKLRRLRAGDLSAALVSAQDMLRIAPEDAPLWRETALINQRLDQVSAALKCFERYLQLVPPGDAATRARTAMDELRARLN
jgi:regulator of sirC expression with transglutaminase-like and TPR domain